MTIDASIDPVRSLSPDGQLLVARIARRHHPLLRTLVVPSALSAEPLLYARLYKKGFEQLENQGPRQATLFVSNHESFKDYVIQLVAIRRSLSPTGRPLPEMGTGENLFRVWHGMLRPLFEEFGYRLHRELEDDDERPSEAMLNRAESAYEMQALLDHRDLFNYPGGGLTRQGHVAQFKRYRLKSPLEANRIAKERGIDLDLSLGVMAIRHEVGAEFTSYDKKGFTNDNKDTWRWREIRRQMVLHKKGDVTLTLAPLIDIGAYQERHPSLGIAEQSRCLAKDAHDLLLSYLPVMSTDAVAYAYTALQERGADRIRLSTLESEVCALLSECPVARFEVAPNIKGLSGEAVTDRALSLLGSQRYPVFDVCAGIVSVREPHALMMYRNRAAQVIDRVVPIRS